MLNRNEKPYRSTLLPRSTNSMSMRTQFAKGEERNLFRKGLTKNLYCSYYHVDQMARRLKRTINSFIKEKKELKESTINLKAENTQKSETLKKIYNPEIKRLALELKEHKLEQQTINEGLTKQMLEVSRSFDHMQGEINAGVKSLNGIDETVGIDTNYF